MAFYKKKPIEIEAHQFTKDTDLIELADWCGGQVQDSNTILIWTLEGLMQAHESDWIIKGIKGEFYPCKADIFEATYVSC